MFELTSWMTGLANWLINAFNGEWQRITDPVPNESIWNRVKRALPLLGAG